MNALDEDDDIPHITPQQIAKAMGVPPALLIRLAIEDQFQAAGLKYTVEIKPAA